MMSSKLSLIKGQKRDFPSALICILLSCCVLLAASGVTFGLYTVRQLDQIKARIIYNENIMTKLGFGQVTKDDSSSKKRETRSSSSWSKEKSQGSEKVKAISIHLQGDGSLFLPKGNPRLNRWTEVQGQGVVYQKHFGTVKIDHPGIYFIYSHIYFKNNKQLSGNYSTHINGKKVMKNALGFQGGAFRLDEGDQVFVSVNCKRKFIVEPATTFGLFLIK